VVERVRTIEAVWQLAAEHVQGLRQEADQLREAVEETKAASLRDLSEVQRALAAISQARDSEIESMRQAYG